MEIWARVGPESMFIVSGAREWYDENTPRAGESQAGKKNIYMSDRQTIAAASV
ncbi:MAG: hypothetical protein ABI876_12615 [Bacteroidota bacterium]